MPEIEINGVSVKFPFEPYDIQRDYMKSVIECLENKGNAILESPTGTGKTLCLLCATLGWVEKQVNENGRNFAPTVIYASRTHSQLSQAMKELKRTEYNHMKSGPVGSRNQLCIHPKLQDKSNTDKTHLCKSKTKSADPINQCPFYVNVLTKLKEPEFNQPVLDIEDLVRHGMTHQCCPFYASREIVKTAEIIFMPYNYLIDPKIRETNQIDLKNSIIILDEAHNVEKFCEESACTYISSTQARMAIRDMKYIVQKVDEFTLCKFETNSKQTKLLKACFHYLEKALNEINIDDTGTHPGGYMFSLLKKAKITKSNYTWYIKLLDKLIALLVDRKSKKYVRVPEGNGLKDILAFLKVAFSTSSVGLRDRVDRCYKVYIEHETVNNNNLTTSSVVQDSDGKKVNFWCFSPAFGMQHLVQQGIRSLILTSGTLAPLKPIVIEMGIEFPVHLENSHIIQNFQVFPKIVGYGVDNVLLDAAYRNRDNRNFLISLGESIVEFAKVVPDGLLVFFPSYGLMNNCERSWKMLNIWAKIEKQKPIFMEPKTKDALKEAMRQYYANINQKKGAIFMAVLRGKVSEGLDFADMYGRGVVIVGIPYGPCKDKKVILKQQYLNENRTRENEMLSGNEWYCLDAIRAVNQAIGRVIRHRNDYGAIFLCDNRYIYKGNESNISSWIRNHLTSQRIGKGGFQETLQQLSQFFSMAQNSLPAPEPNFSLENQVIYDESLLSVHQNDLMDDDDEPLIDEGPSDDEPEDGLGDFNDDDFAAPELMFERQTNASAQSLLEPQPSTSRNNESNAGDSNESGILPKRSRIEEASTSNTNANQTPPKNPLLKYVQNDLGPEKYELLETAFDLYDNDSNYETFRDSLFEVFRETRVLSLLKCMTLLFVTEHRSRFDEDSNVFIRSHLNN